MYDPSFFGDDKAVLTHAPTDIRSHLRRFQAETDSKKVTKDILSKLYLNSYYDMIRQTKC